MDGIAVASNLTTSSRASQLSGPSRKVLSDVKEGQIQRKVLGELNQNVNKNSKVVSFDNRSKPSSKKVLPFDNRVTTPSARQTEAASKTPGNKSLMKSGGNSFKIYSDAQVSQSVRETSSRYDPPETKEYMAPCTDGDFDIPLPDYLVNVIKHKPTFNVPYFNKSNTPMVSVDDLLLDACTLADDLVPYVCSSDLEFIESDLIDIDHELLLQMENDVSFSLERLDENLLSAGLEVPEW